MNGWKNIYILKEDIIFNKRSESTARSEDKADIISTVDVKIIPNLFLFMYNLWRVTSCFSIYLKMTQITLPTSTKHDFH